MSELEFDYHLYSPDADNRPVYNEDHTDDVLPSVSFDVKLGQHFSFIDVDYNNLIQHMRDQGFPSHEIDKTSIHLSDEIQPLWLEKDGVKRRPRGDFFSATKHIVLYPTGTALDAFDNPSIYPGRDPENINHPVQKAVSEHVDDTLVHELRHKYINLYDDMYAERKTHTSKIKAMKVGKVLTSCAALLIAKDAYIFQDEVNTETVAMSAASSIAMLAVTRRATKTSIRNAEIEAYDTDPEEAICNQAIEENQLRFFTFDY